MNKENILAKSRNENKDMDVYEKEVLKEAGNVGAIVAAVLCGIFFAIQIFLRKETNWGLWAIFFSIQAAVFTVKAIRMKRKHEIVVSIIYIAATLAMSAMYIYSLIVSSTIR
ncbi:MAG: DUF6442 family protein [Bacillota bacterium]|nr:DUF6442 family protein [Bacillota bacterium]